MPEQNLNPDAYEYRLDVLVQHRAKGTDDDFKTFGLALTQDGRECLGESIDDLNSMLSTGVFEVVEGPMPGHCENCFTALPAQPAHFEAKDLNRKGWHCGLCEPGEYEHCHHCAKACDELADFLNRNYHAQPDTVKSVDELDALSVGSIIRSVHLGIVRERLETGWLAVGGDAIVSSRYLCEQGLSFAVLHRQGA